MFIGFLILISIMSVFALDFPKGSFHKRWLPNYLRKVYDIHHVSAFERGISKDDYLKGEFIQHSFGHFFFYARSTGLKFKPEVPIEDTFKEIISINKWLLDSGKPIMEWEKFSFEYYLEFSIMKFVSLMDLDELKVMIFGKPNALTLQQRIDAQSDSDSDSDEKELDEIVDTLKATQMTIEADGSI